MKCAIVSGSPIEENDFLINSLKNQEFIICADSGYKKCIKAGYFPNLIIGDFDSSEKPDINTEIISLPTHKDDTDTFSCVKEAINRGFNDILLLSAIGDRIDHTYSNILCLEYCREHNVKCVIQNEKNKIILVDKKTKLISDGYKYFSVFSFSDYCEGVSIKHAAYNVDNINLNKAHQFGQSNQFSDGYSFIDVKNGILLIIFSND